MTIKDVAEETQGTMKLAFLVIFEGPIRESEPFAYYLGGKMWDDDLWDSFTGYSDDNWFPLRRIFPDAGIIGNKLLYPCHRIDNG